MNYLRVEDISPFLSLDYCFRYYTSRPATYVATTGEILRVCNAGYAYLYEVTESEEVKKEVINIGELKGTNFRKGFIYNSAEALGWKTLPVEDRIRIVRYILDQICNIPAVKNGLIKFHRSVLGYSCSENLFGYSAEERGFWTDMGGTSQNMYARLVSEKRLAICKQELENLKNDLSPLSRY